MESEPETQKIGKMFHKYWDQQWPLPHTDEVNPPLLRFPKGAKWESRLNASNESMSPEKSQKTKNKMGMNGARGASGERCLQRWEILSETTFLISQTALSSESPI